MFPLRFTFYVLRFLLRFTNLLNLPVLDLMNFPFPISFGLRISVFGFLLCFATPSPAADLVHAKDGSGVYGYNDTPKLPWCQWLVHDPDRPNPKRIDPGKAQP